MLFAVAEFAHWEAAGPLRLWAVVVVPLVLLLTWIGTATHSRRRLAAMGVCRAMLLLCLAVAWADVAWRGPTSRPFVVLVEDCSDSVAASGSASSVSSLSPDTAWLQFAGETGPYRGPPGTGGAPAAPLDRLESYAALAIRRASAVAPPDYVPTLVLATDGRATRDGTFGAATAMPGPIHVVPLMPFAAPEVCVLEIIAPAVARPLEPFDLEVVVASNHDDNGQLALMGEGVPAQTRAVHLVKGVNQFAFRVALRRGVGSQEFRATIAGCRDTYQENNHRRAVVYTAPSSRLLLIDSEPELATPLANALGREGYAVTVGNLKQLPASVGGLDEFDVLMLSDAPSDRMSPGQRQAVDQYVRELGGGLIVLGGESAFGSQKLSGNWLEKLLPVTAAVRPPQLAPRLALVLVIDRSLSMNDDRKLEMAKEAARRTVQLDLIAPQDLVGLLAFGDTSQWIAPLEPCGDKQRPLAQISSLKAEGETNMGPALERAYLALRQATADRRHVILLTDGVSSPADFGQIASRMAAAGITVSTVSLGQDADQKLLADIAHAAGGRHYHCENALDVPRILVAETRSAVGSGGPAEFRPLVYKSWPQWDVASAPPLRGFAAVNPKPAAELVLLTPGGDPLLAWWPRDRGRVLTFMSDAKNRSAATWQAWSGFGPFWARLVHQVERVHPQRFQMLATRRLGRLRVSLDALSADGSYLNGAAATLTVRRAGSRQNTETVAMPQLAPGRYEAEIDTARPDRYELTASVGRGGAIEFSQTQTVAVDYPDELTLGPADEKLLRDVATATGGRYDIKPDDIRNWPSSGRQVERRIGLRPYLMVSALLLLVGEIALRRLGRRRQNFRETAADPAVQAPRGVAVGFP